MTLRHVRPVGGAVRPAPSNEWSPGKLALAMNLPSGLLILGVIGYPLVYTVNVAFREAGVRGFVTGQMPWVGLKNFATVLADAVFLATFVQTIVFVGLSVLLEVAIGLGIALTMNMRYGRLTGATKALLLLPWAVPPVVNGVMWSYIFNSNYGALNAALYRLGFIDEYVQWISDPRLALLAIVVAYVWRTVPFGAIIFYAALRTIPQELYESASIDGGGAWQRWRYITWPLLKPTVAVVLILRTIFSFMVFDEIFAITNGGPGDSTWTAAWYIYSFAFRFFKFGPAAAAAIILTAVIAVISVLYVRLLYRKIEY
jgi:ABC-type sugar transport system permease subunit